LACGFSLVLLSRRSSDPTSGRTLVKQKYGWIESAGMDSTAYCTHSLRRTKVAQIYRKTGNLRTVASAEDNLPHELPQWHVASA
jgi:hypothetical protein